MEDYDDERWDEHSDAASTMDRPPSSLIDEPVQLTFRGQQSLVEPHRSVFKPSRPARPETKVFYSSSKQVADLIAEISRSHDTGSLQFQASTPSPTSSSFPTSPPPAPLNLPKRSISVRRRSQHSTAALAPHHQHHGSGGGSGGRGVSDAPSLSPSQLSVETNLDRLMGSLMLQGESEGGKRESLV
ncbi:hypothetical protein BDY24DRAFT_173708 [Mrakia frigida]|uniref:uncharacterized protein n=1 Tax=Mrakia frigida TaxID=29902 RepID=UPI003FCC24A4